MTTYQVVYGSETNGISCYGNDHLGYTYIVHIDGEEVAEVEGEENYADAAEIFDRMFFGIGIATLTNSTRYFKFKTI